jgi:hypothetical protein
MGDRANLSGGAYVEESCAEEPGASGQENSLGDVFSQMH